jgi:ElaB/YqjD/DUF883 family membrane-anchored ribosome-binding protein
LIAEGRGDIAASARNRDAATLKNMYGAEMGEEAVRTTETDVRDNPWQALTIAADVGLVLGLLLTRR